MPRPHLNIADLEAEVQTKGEKLSATPIAFLVEKTPVNDVFHKPRLAILENLFVRRAIRCHSHSKAFGHATDARKKARIRLCSPYFSRQEEFNRTLTSRA